MKRALPQQENATGMMGSGWRVLCVGPWFRALGNYLSALLAVQAGDANQALAAVRESLTLLRETGDRFGVVYAFAPLAAAASLVHEDRWVARIVGASDALTERSSIRSVDPVGQQLWARARMDAQDRFGSEQWARAYEAGRRSSIDVLLREINRAYRSLEQRPIRHFVGGKPAARNVLM